MNLTERLLGTKTVQDFLLIIFFACIGIAIISLISTTDRNLERDRTPKVFRWKIFFLDNWKRFTLSLLLIYVSIRFCYTIFSIELTEFAALSIGMSLDGLSQFLKNKTNILGSKKQF